MYAKEELHISKHIHRELWFSFTLGQLDIGHVVKLSSHTACFLSHGRWKNIFSLQPAKALGQLW